MAARETTTDVRIWVISTYKGKRGNTYNVRWTAGGVPHKEGRKTKALADVFRAELLSAARRGEAFDFATGLPLSMLPKETGYSWYEHACAFVDAQWSRSAPRSRQSRADALATVSAALVQPKPGRPDPGTLRSAL